MKKFNCSHFVRTVIAVILAALVLPEFTAQAQHSVARQWNEALMNAIRRNIARPTVHGRNLFHTSIAMWDGWATYDDTATTYFLRERHTAADVKAARNETISYAAYRLLMHRFATSMGGAISVAQFNALMGTLGYDINVTTTEGDSPAAVGNRIAALIIRYGLADRSNEAANYARNNGYEPVNPPLVVGLPGIDVVNPNRWQPLALSFFIDQSGIVLGPYPAFFTPHWGWVWPFSLTDEDRSGPVPAPHLDPGPPPLFGEGGDEEFRACAIENLTLSSHHDPFDGVMMDASPASRGNNPFLTNDGTGYPVNPVTGEPYEPQIVPRGDWTRVLVRYWADGPNSETPPGHWNTVANYVTDHPMFERRFQGQGDIVDDLEWDVKLYFALNGGLHDTAVACWGAKGFYDWSRPITHIRFLCQNGQSSDPQGPSYSPNGIPLVEDLVEVITAQSSAPGERHEHLADYVGEIAVRTWRGSPEDPHTQVSGVGWILGVTWVPYFPANFVSPPFAGYYSGHSTFSRTGAEILTLITGSPYFPGGLGEFHAAQNGYLDADMGPSIEMSLQWASYFDASDESSLSRRYGGIHPFVDDFPGRVVGSIIGPRAFNRALRYFNGTARCHTADRNLSNSIELGELLRVIQFFNSGGFHCEEFGEDGFAPGAGSTNCIAHDADYNPQDWRITLTEVLRVIQLYNIGIYCQCPGGDPVTEDGLCPGLDPATVI